MIKKRKPRGIKKNGRKGEDLCPWCLSFNCDPGTMSEKFQAKVRKRLDQGLCPSCGTNPCKCKSNIRNNA